MFQSGVDKKPELGPNNFGFVETGFVEPFHIVYERKQMPDFGALEYAYESLALPPMPPVGAGTAVARLPIQPMQPPQAYSVLSVVTNGIWLEGGAYYNQPLVDENGNPIPMVPAEPFPLATKNGLPGQTLIDQAFVQNNPHPFRRL